MAMDNIHVRIKARIFQAGATQEQIAHVMRMESSLFSRILRGLRPMPPNFETDVLAALDRVVAAENAAQQERERVLAEGER